MKHFVAVVFKFLMISVILELTLSYLTLLSFGEILVLSAAVTAVAYIVDDLLILSISGNIIATLSDGVLAFAVLYLFNFMPGYGLIRVRDCAVSIVFLMIGEWFFHKYMEKNVYHRRYRESRQS